MKIITAVLGLMLMGMAAHSAQILRDVSWTDYANKKGYTRSQAMPPNRDTHFSHLKIDNPSSRPATVRVFTFDNPGIREQTYAVTGMVRYEHVEGKAYLEMMSIFSGGKQYFSRTFDSGMMAPLTGSSGWRRFILPFDLMDTRERPKALRINVVLPGRGTVYLGPLSLVEPARYAEMMGMPGQWWSPMWAARWAGIIGGGFGALFGLLGALTGMLASRGKARAFVLGVWTAFVGISTVSLIAGIIALVIRQPYWVYYPLLLSGFIGTVVGGSLLPQVRRAYNQAELRRMEAQDVACKQTSPRF